MISLEEGLTTSLSSSGSVLAAGSRPTIGQKVYGPFYEQAKQLYLEKPTFSKSRRTGYGYRLRARATGGPGVPRDFARED
jgi:hypothetical protein